MKSECIANGKRLNTNINKCEVAQPHLTCFSANIYREYRAIKSYYRANEQRSDTNAQRLLSDCFEKQHFCFEDPFLKMFHTLYPQKKYETYVFKHLVIHVICIYIS